MSKASLFILLLVSGIVLQGCDQETASDLPAKNTAEVTANKAPAPISRSVLDEILQRKILRVVTRNAPTSYYHGVNGKTGFEYEMVNDLADYLGVGVEFIVKEDVGSVLDVLRNGEADLAAAGLTHTGRREKEFLFGPGYQHIRQQVVCRRGGRQARTIDELSTVVLAVVSESSYEEKLKEWSHLVPGLSWNSVKGVSDEQLLEEVVARSIDCTVADSNIVAVNRRYHPELKILFDLTEPEELAWAMLPKATQLQTAVDEWFEGYWSGGKVQRLLDAYYGHTDNFDYVDIRALLRRLESRLPAYRSLFEQAAAESGFSWALLAAQAYQESHWDENATSSTGVKGLMMLTQTTAKELGVTDRTDPRQVIPAGAYYLGLLKDRLPKTVKEPDRTWMALAAYNMGMAHVWDARTLARKLGKDPDHWNSLKEVLPLLSQHQHYSSLKYGYARGYEARSYVQRIRNYYDVISVVMSEAEVNPE